MLPKRLEGKSFGFLLLCQGPGGQGGGLIQLAAPVPSTAPGRPETRTQRRLCDPPERDRGDRGPRSRSGGRCGGAPGPASDLLLFAGLAPAVAVVGGDAQEEVGGHGRDGDHEAHEGDEEVIVQGQAQVAGLEALLCEREEGGTLDFRGASALSQLGVCNTETAGEALEGTDGRESPPPRPGGAGVLLSYFCVPHVPLTFCSALNNPQGKYFSTY